MPSDLDELLEYIDRWKEINKLSFELAETVGVLLDCIIDYCRKEHIPLYKEKGLWSLVRKARCLFREIEEINSRHSVIYQKLSDDFSHKKPSDEDYTEP